MIMSRGGKETSIPCACPTSPWACQQRVGPSSPRTYSTDWDGPTPSSTVYCFLLFVIFRTKHFRGLKIICHVLVQLTILSRSCCRRLQSSLVDIAKHSRLSSANRRILDVMSLPISLIYKRNIKGNKSICSYWILVKPLTQYHTRVYWKSWNHMA
jgi:hypothetical protein